MCKVCATGTEVWRVLDLQVQNAGRPDAGAGAADHAASSPDTVLDACKGTKQSDGLPRFVGKAHSRSAESVISL